MKILFLLLIAIPMLGLSQTNNDPNSVIEAKDLCFKELSSNPKTFGYLYFHQSETDLMSFIGLTRKNYKLTNRTNKDNLTALFYEIDGGNNQNINQVFLFDKEKGCIQMSQVIKLEQLPALVVWIDANRDNVRISDMKWANMKQAVGTAIVNSDEGNYTNLIYTPLYPKN